MDIDKNFSCADSGLSRVNVSEYLWMIKSEGAQHESSITALAAVQLLYVLVGLPWNSVVAITILVKQLFKDPSYVLLLSLVFSDLLVCVFIPFNILSGLRQAFTLGNSDYTRCQFCQAVVVVGVSSILVSLFSLALLASDRLLYIKWPFIYKERVTAARATAAVIAVWIFCFLVSIPPVFGFGEIKFANTLGACSIIFNKVTANLSYGIVVALIGTAPFTFTLIVNIWLLVIACKSISQMHKRVRQNTSTALHGQASERKTDMEYHKKQIHLAMVFGVIFAVHLVIWGASSFLLIMSIGINFGDVPSSLLAKAYLVILSQPAIHPMLETCLIGKAKSAMEKCLCVLCRKKTLL